MVEIHNQAHKIVIITGSIGSGSYTAKAAQLVADEFNNYDFITLETIRPEKYDISFPGSAGGKTDAQLLQRKISEASGIILATPEYHGSFSGLLKMTIENLGYPSALAGKPVALLGVASGAIGAVKSLEHLRSVCSHVGALVLPGPVSIAAVEEYFDKEGNCTDPIIEKRIRSLAGNMINFLRNHINPKIALEELVRQRKEEC